MSFFKLVNHVKVAFVTLSTSAAMVVVEVELVVDALTIACAQSGNSANSGYTIAPHL